MSPVQTQQIRFVVCLDSMGQDREFTLSQKNFALNAVYKYRQYWEQFEEARLLADRDALVRFKEEDTEIFTEEYLNDKEEKSAALVESFLNPPAKEEGAED